MEGSCGTPILDDSGHVLSFFSRFLGDKGMGIGCAANKLVLDGYTLF